MIKTIALVVALAVGALMIYAATRPDVMHVQRSARIEAPAAAIHPLIEDMHAFNSWNPYLKKDPSAKGSYSGPASGAGSTYAFDGNKDIGKGSIRILDTTKPDRVAMQLDMIEPFEGHNAIEFKLVPQGNATEVTWSMQGPSPFIAKLVGVFVNMDRMIGRDFETGLASLKTLAERR